MVGNTAMAICAFSLLPFVIMILVGVWRIEPQRLARLPPGGMFEGCPRSSCMCSIRVVQSLPAGYCVLVICVVEGHKGLIPYPPFPRSRPAPPGLKGVQWNSWLNIVFW